MKEGGRNEGGLEGKVLEGGREVRRNGRGKG